MEELFEHIVHPHIEARKDLGPAKVKTSVSGWNNRIGVFITTVVGTMWAAYLFMMLTFVSLPGALSTHNTVIIVSWVAQTFLQLVLLPVIIVGQNVQSQAADKRAEQTYNDAEAILHEALQLQAHLKEQDKILLASQEKIFAQEQQLNQALQTLQALVLAEKPAPRPRTRKAVES